MHSKKNVTGVNSSMGGPNYYRPPQQFIPNSNNKTFTGMMNNPKLPLNAPPTENANISSQSINYINPNKNNLGYGRYS